MSEEQYAYSTAMNEDDDPLTSCNCFHEVSAPQNLYVYFSVEYMNLLLITVVIFYFQVY